MLLFAIYTYYKYSIIGYSEKLELDPCGIWLLNNSSNYCWNCYHFHIKFLWHITQKSADHLCIDLLLDATLFHLSKFLSLHKYRYLD
jgi:hypothetical protein